jgi:hypothetical protein
MIDNDIYVIDNVITEYKQNQIEDLFISSKLPWIFFKDIAISDSEIKRLGITKLTPGIGCYIKQDNPKYVNEFLLKETSIIPQSACKAIDKECKEIFNGRAFMHFPLVSELRTEHDNIHIDVKYPHLVCLYYINDSDGDTFLFDKTLNDTPTLLKTTKLEVIKRVTPKKGRVLLFNGNRYHSSSGPTKSVRCVLNFNVSI